MRRERRDLQDLLATLGSEVSPPSEHDLRDMARAASSRSRPLATPARPRRWPLQARSTGLLVLALVVAIGLGVGLGALIAPSSSAAPAPIGTGFLPDPGWTVLQTGSDATRERQALAVASNVPLHPDDSARGIRESSGLPYSTLLELPSSGVVIVALFTRRESEPWNEELYPERQLPLHVRDAMHSISYSYQMRPQRPLGQYELRATVGDHHISLFFYFGTQHPSPKLSAAAQRQLERLIVASASAEAPRLTRQPSRTAAPAASRIVDRTVLCPTGNGTPREIDLSAKSGIRVRGDRSKWQDRPSAGFLADKTWIPGRGNAAAAGVTAGWPPAKYDGFPVSPRSLSISTRCQPSRARVSLSTAGLSGAVASQFGDEYDCVVPGAVLVRVMSVFGRPTAVRRVRQRIGFSTSYQEQLVADGPVSDAVLAIRTPTGKAIAVATVHESGRARLFLGNTCGPNG